LPADEGNVVRGPSIVRQFIVPPMTLSSRLQDLATLCFQASGPNNEEAFYMQSKTREVGYSGMRWLGSILLLVSLWVRVSLTASAQTTVGSITGVVSDPTGAVVPGAKVTLTDINKGYTYPAVADTVGRYVISNLPASNYKLAVEAPGFKSSTQEGIVLDVAAKLAIDVRLQIGATTQTVEVTGAAPVLHTQDAVTGQEIDRSAINDLPL